MSEHRRNAIEKAAHAAYEYEHVTAGSSRKYWNEFADGERDWWLGMATTVYDAIAADLRRAFAEEAAQALEAKSGISYPSYARAAEIVRDLGGIAEGDNLDVTHWHDDEEDDDA